MPIIHGVSEAARQDAMECCALRLALLRDRSPCEYVSVLSALSGENQIGNTLV
jgi:hypothetical protein